MWEPVELRDVENPHRKCLRSLRERCRGRRERERERKEERERERERPSPELWGPQEKCDRDHMGQK